MTTGLLKTKLYRPFVRPGLVLRPNLARRLDEGLHSRLTVVSAPAGYGKTTFVSAWAAACPSPVAWLSLEDKDDNDPARFLSYLIAAAQTIQPGLGQEILSLLPSPQPPAIRDLLSNLINALDGIQERFVLVLDDYHLITSPEIHQAITFLIEHQPPRMNLILITRIDPPLPLSHLRGRGQLTELRQADLRFSEEETHAFLKYGAGIELSLGEERILLDRTEGWAAGLQIAVLSMQKKSDISAFITRFGGSHEYIVDYFASEILTGLPEPVKAFLIKTSFLEPLCGPLCNAVTGQTDGQQMLERLQAENLFLIPLDDEHTWYRYHPLFADFLQKNLKQGYPGDLPDLHLHASRWFEQNAFQHQAVEHAFLAGDTRRAARLLEDIADSALARGEHLWMLKNIEQLPEAQMEEHLRLRILRAAIFTSTGALPKAEEALGPIEAFLTAHAASLPDQEYGLGRAVALRAMIAILRGDVNGARRDAQLALEKLSRGTRREAPWRADSLLVLGLAAIVSGDLMEARQNLALALEDAKLAGNPFTFLDVSAYQVEVLWSQGSLNEAMALCEEGLLFIDTHNLGLAPMSSALLLRRCLLCCERYEIGQAENFLNRGMDLIRRGGDPSVQAWADYINIFYWIARGDLPAAAASAQEAVRLPQFSELPARVASGISALQALIWVRQGRLDEAEQFLKKRGIRAGGAVRYPFHREYLSLAALLIAKGDLHAAESLLESMIGWAEATKQYRTLICARVLQSLAYAELKNTQKALHSLALALDMAEPEGYFQAILEVGRPVLPLLYAAVQKGVHAEFATRLLDVFKETRPDLMEKSDTQKRQPDNLTPLRPREVEVLKLVADGQTNKEIAQELQISLRTVKFHMTCILTKLGVDNRLQAVAKAKILGIVQ